MATPITRLSGRKKNDLHRLVAKPRRAPNLAETGPTNPLQRVFVVHFDGTQNDLEAVPEEFQETLVAKSYRAIQRSESLVSHYYPGVGTRTDPFTGLLEAAFGIGCSDRAETAYQDLVKATKKWRAVNPLAQVHVHVVGFSRGSAIGLHFMNLVHQRGIPVADELPAGADMTMYEVGLTPGTVPISAVLLDTVATGQTDTLSLGLPHSAISVLHLTAGLELRALFPLTSVADRGRPSEAIDIQAAQLGPDGSVARATTHKFRRLHEVMLAGACHSDVGGSYRDGGIRAVSDYLMSEFQQSLGLPVTPKKPTFGEIQGVHAHDSRYLIDKLSPDRPYQRGTRRAIEEAPVSDWTGEIRLCASVSLKPGASVKDSRAISYPLLRAEQASAAPSDVALGKEYKVTIAMDDGQLSCTATPAGALVCADGLQSVTLHGLDITAHIHRHITSEEAIKHLAGKRSSITLSVRLEKDIPSLTLVHSNLQVPAEAATTYQRDVVDNWPLAVRSTIMRLNETAPPLPQKEAREIVLRCLQELVDEIGASPERGDLQVTFTPRASTRASPGTPIELAAVVVNPTDVPPSDLHTKLKHSQDALSCLFGTLRQFRVHVPLQEPITLAPTPPKRAATRRQAVAEQPEKPARSRRTRARG